METSLLRQYLIFYGQTTLSTLLAGGYSPLVRNRANPLTYLPIRIYHKTWRLWESVTNLSTYLLTYSLTRFVLAGILRLRDLGKGFEGIEWIRLLKEALLFVSNGFSLMRSKLTDSWNFMNHIINWKFVHDVSGRSKNTFWSLVLIIFEGLDLEIINAI